MIFFFVSLCPGVICLAEFETCSTLIGMGGQDRPEQAARPNRAALARDPPHSNSAPGEVWSRRLLGVREPPLPPGGACPCALRMAPTSCVTISGGTSGLNT